MTIALICIALLTVCAIEFSKRRWKKTQSPPSMASEMNGTTTSARSSRVYAVVDREKARLDPYPYVYIEEDGGARELHSKEQEYLETPFQFGDGGRPYTKSSYEQKNGWGKTNGFLERSKVPGQVQIAPAPVGDPEKPVTKSDISQLMRNRGFDVKEGANGSIIATRRNPGVKPTD